MKTAQRIRILRENEELTQAQIAELLHTSQTVYSRYERNERNLPIDYLYTLCKFYNVSADYILGFSDTPRKLK